MRRSAHAPRRSMMTSSKRIHFLLAELPMSPRQNRARKRKHFRFAADGRRHFMTGGVRRVASGRAALAGFGPLRSARPQPRARLWERRNQTEPGAVHWQLGGRQIKGDLCTRHAPLLFAQPRSDKTKGRALHEKRRHWGSASGVCAGVTALQRSAPGWMWARGCGTRSLQSLHAVCLQVGCEGPCNH